MACCQQAIQQKERLKLLLKDLIPIKYIYIYIPEYSWALGTGIIKLCKQKRSVLCLFQSENSTSKSVHRWFMGSTVWWTRLWLDKLCKYNQKALKHILIKLYYYNYNEPEFKCSDLTKNWRALTNQIRTQDSIQKINGPRGNCLH